MPDKPRFKVGQVVMWHRSKHGKKRDVPLQILAETNVEGVYFYQINKRNWLAEHMLRELSEGEK